MSAMPSSSTNSIKESGSSSSDSSHGEMIEKPPDIHVPGERAPTRRHCLRENEDGKSSSTEHLQGMRSKTLSEEDSLPNGGYGWVCVGCVFWINVCTWGISSVSLDRYSSSFPVFVESEIHPLGNRRVE